MSPSIGVECVWLEVVVAYFFFLSFLAPLELLPEIFNFFDLGSSSSSARISFSESSCGGIRGIDEMNRWACQSTYLFVNSLFLEVFNPIELSAQVVAVDVNWSTSLGQAERHWRVWEFQEALREAVLTNFQYCDGNFDCLFFGFCLNL
jgi:hypothetical protein